MGIGEHNVSHARMPERFNPLQAACGKNTATNNLNSSSSKN